MVLFPHDDRMVTLVGEDGYVRWMDDQNIGAQSRAQAMKLLGEVGRSLAALNLTPNSAKSQILSTAQARRHFHLDINDALDPLDQVPVSTAAQRRLLGRRLSGIWRRALRHEGTGESVQACRTRPCQIGYDGERLGTFYESLTQHSAKG